VLHLEQSWILIVVVIGLVILAWISFIPQHSGGLGDSQGSITENNRHRSQSQIWRHFIGSIPWIAYKFSGSRHLEIFQSAVGGNLGRGWSGFLLAKPVSEASKVTTPKCNTFRSWTPRKGPEKASQWTQHVFNFNTSFQKQLLYLHGCFNMSMSK
jgi:hypothetical protein